MSEYVVSTKPREPPPVYRCGNHWHFHPAPESTWWNPGPPNIWYTHSKSPEETFAIGPVYARDAGDSPYFVDDLLLSGFCSLYKERQPREWCTGRYGKRERPLWREEELSKTPWASREPPSYEAGEEEEESKKKKKKDDELPAYEEGSSSKLKGDEKSAEGKK